MNYSDWNKVDIHIHSKKSNDVKPNDYSGNEYDAKKILDILTNDDNKVGIFSITDHNCINDSLYKEIDSLIKTDEYSRRINYIIGVELDINDLDIHDEVFHCLCFFDSIDIDLIKKCVDEAFNSVALLERNTKTNYPTIHKIFNVFQKNGIHDILLIPHFHNKSKGLPSNDMAIENLNYLCFDAYEDANNVANINKSLKVYLEAGYDNFPFAVFSDSHNIEVYPKDKDGNKCTACYMLSNLAYPFNSLKTSFQEPRLRISIDGIDKMRQAKKPEKYVRKVIFNGQSLELSPYQNTIIGRFGSGKTLLLEKIRSGVSSLKTNTSYSEFYLDSDSFKLVIGNQQVDSMNEALSSHRNLRKYEFIQQEEYSYKSSLSLNDAKSLFQRLNIPYEFIKNKTFEFNSEALKSSFNNFNFFYNKNDVINNLNYEKAFTNEEFYSVNISACNTDYENVITKLSNNSDIFSNLKSLKISSISIFNDAELKIFETILKLISEKKQKINFIKQSNIESEIEALINSYNDEYINNNSKESKSKFIDDIDKFVTNLLNLNSDCKNFEEIYDKDIYNSSKEKIISILYGEYKISAEYSNIEEFKDCINTVIQKNSRNSTLFKSILDTLYKNDGIFAHNKSASEFGIMIDKYCSEVNNLFKETNVVYDILLNDDSLLRKSAGEKSSLFIKLIFDLIENDILSEKNILLIFDQPESNIDNDNIFKQITNKLKEFKIKYNNFQSIIVTHNANVGITADSENIIVAKEILDTQTNKKSFEYHSGCIENKEFIKDVCDILEGGKVAMEQRTIKYGINIIKKVRQNEL